MLKKAGIFVIALAVILSTGYAITPNDTLFEWSVEAERKLAGLSIKQVNISDSEMVYLEGGSGEPLVLLHGFGANKDNWNRIALSLTKHYRVIAPDLPGFGDSSKNIDYDYDVLAQVARLNEFIDTLGLTQVHIAGNSMGGYIAGNYAAKHPEKVKSLWLLNPLGVASAKDSEMFTMIRNGEPPVVLARNLPDYEKLISFVFHNKPFMPDFFVTELAKRAEQSYDIQAKIFDDLHNVAGDKLILSSPLDEALISFNKPTLITWGKQDRILHADGANKLASKLTNVNVELMENMGHLPMIEAPKVTANQFLVFAQK
ncbi:alpha/beta fold hydrolase [Thalassotalea euphylliae]|uniref:alpha/beta fold hydrolase n=1 Tax=Thalassotalea euphylliae TaxID=1655234 RepID=UPI0036434169